MISVASIVVTVTNKSKRFTSCLPHSFFLCIPPWAAVTHKCAGTTRGCVRDFWPFPMVLLATPYAPSEARGRFLCGLAAIPNLFVEQTQFDGFDGRLGAIRD